MSSSSPWNVVSVSEMLPQALPGQLSAHTRIQGMGPLLEGQCQWLGFKSVHMDMKGWKEMFVEEHCVLCCQALLDPHNDPAESMLYNQAIQYLHAHLLHDLSPPWFAHQSLQALTRAEVLCCAPKRATAFELTH